MPTHRELERLIGTAVVDSEFRACLLESPATAAAAFALSAEELDALKSADSSSLEELASHLYAWITNAPKPRYMSPLRWPLDGYQAARIAV